MFEIIYRQKLEARRDWLMKKERSVCTFKPVISTRPAARRYWNKRANARLNASTRDVGDIEESTDEPNQRNTSMDSVSVDSFRTDDSLTKSQDTKEKR